jgi:hypothetical protein
MAVSTASGDSSGQILQSKNNTKHTQFGTSKQLATRKGLENNGNPRFFVFLNFFDLNLFIDPF